MHNERHEEAILRVVPRRQRMPRIAWRRIRSAHRPVRPFSLSSFLFKRVCYSNFGASNYRVPFRLITVLVRCSSRLVSFSFDLFLCLRSRRNNNKTNDQSPFSFDFVRPVGKFFFFFFYLFLFQTSREGGNFEIENFRVLFSPLLWLDLTTHLCRNATRALYFSSLYSTVL